MKTLIRRIEFWSGVVVLVMMALIPLLFHMLGVPDALNLLLTLLVSGIAQVLLLRFIYQRRQVIRHKTVDQVREMLRDRMLNRLAFIWLQVQRSGASEAQRSRIQQVLKEIEADIAHLSAEQLEEWLNTYRNIPDLDDTQILRRTVLPPEQVRSA